MNKRFETADDIASFIEHTELWVKDIIDPLGWSKEHIVEAEEKYPCEHDQNHYVSKKDLEKHKEICKLRKEGYSREDLEKDISSDYFYEKSTTVVPVKLEQQVLQRLLNTTFNNQDRGHNDEIPHTMDRYFKVVSPAQRLQVYEHCIQSARATERLESKSEQELMMLSETVRKAESNKPKSRLELLIEERNQKRRRTSYKKVHSGKKSHLEVMREVIANQMEILQELEEGLDGDGEEKEQEDENYRHETREKSSRRDNYSRQKRSRSRSAENHNRRPRGRSRESERAAEKHYRRSRERSRSKEKHSSRHRRRSRERSRSGDRYYGRSRGESRDRSRDRNKKSRRSRSRSVSKSHKKKSSKRQDRSRSRDRHEHKKKSKHKVKEEPD